MIKDLHVLWFEFLRDDVLWLLNTDHFFRGTFSPKGIPVNFYRKKKKPWNYSLILLFILFRHLDACHLQQSGMVSVVFLIFTPLWVRLVPFTGPNQLLDVVEQCRVQRVGVNQTHQVLPVVLPARTQMSAGTGGKATLSTPTKCSGTEGLTRRAQPVLAESGPHRGNRFVDPLHPSVPSHNKHLRDK